MRLLAAVNLVQSLTTSGHELTLSCLETQHVYRPILPSLAQQGDALIRACIQHGDTNLAQLSPTQRQSITKPTDILFAPEISWLVNPRADVASDLFLQVALLPDLLLMLLGSTSLTFRSKELLCNLLLHLEKALKALIDVYDSTIPRVLLSQANWVDPCLSRAIFDQISRVRG